MALWVLPEAIEQERAYHGPPCLPPHLVGKVHEDWAWKWLGRKFTYDQTSWCGLEMPPLQIAGNQNDFPVGTRDLGPKPNPPPGKWQLSVVVISKAKWKFSPYFAYHSEDGLLLSIGFFRWDDVDGRYISPRLALKRPGYYAFQADYSPTRPTR